MDLGAIIYILLGSTIGLGLRLFLKHKLRNRKEFSLNKSLTVNSLAALFLGIIIALDLTNKNFVLASLIGFLGCFSTFSSFIYELFYLIHKRKYLSFMIYYFEVLGISFVFFCSGYFVTLIFVN